MLRWLLHKNTLLFSFLFFSFVFKAECAEGTTRLVIHDFNSSEALTHVDVWERNVLDHSQGVKVSQIRVADHTSNENGILRIDYDVESVLPAMVGIVFQFQDEDLSSFEKLHIRIRSEESPYSGGSVAVQFKDERNRRDKFYLYRITDEWKEFVIPLRKFSRIHDWSKVKTVELVIDDVHAKPKAGVLFVDDISVSRLKEDGQ